MPYRTWYHSWDKQNQQQHSPISKLALYTSQQTQPSSSSSQQQQLANGSGPIAPSRHIRAAMPCQAPACVPLVQTRKGRAAVMWADEWGCTTTHIPPKSRYSLELAATVDGSSSRQMRTLGKGGMGHSLGHERISDAIPPRSYIGLEGRPSRSSSCHALELHRSSNVGNSRRAWCEGSGAVGWFRAADADCSTSSGIN